jgi:TMEM175 potassium channel family protein
MAEAPEAPQTEAMYPRHRLDALADGIYGVAMTLLVLEIRIPDGVDYTSDRQLIALLVSLAPKFWPYALSFAVLGGRWRAMVLGRTSHAPVGRRYVTWALTHLFLVTLMPFSTLVIGRFASLAPGLWLYTANLVGLSVSAWLMSRSAPAPERGEVDDNTIGLALLLVSAALVLALSFLHTAWATLGFLLTGLTPLAERLVRGRLGVDRD